MKEIGLVMVLMVAPAAMAQEEAEVPSTSGMVSKVTVYRKQAMVTRKVDVRLPEAHGRLIVTDLPRAIVGKSLHARGLEETKVLSVGYIEREIPEEQRREVKEISDRIKQVRNEILRAEQDMNHVESMSNHYGRFWELGFSGSAADLNRGLLQAEPLAGLTSHLEKRLNELHSRRLEIELQRRELNNQLEELEQQRLKLSAEQPAVMREAVLFVECGRDSRAALELGYVVENAGWLPQYNLKADLKTSDVLVEYNALVHQTTGEDWTQVQLGLSTAEPAMVAAPPILEPMKVELAAGGEPDLGREGREAREAPILQREPGKFYEELGERYGGIQRQKRQTAARGRVAQHTLNVLASEQQMMEIQADTKAREVMHRKAEDVARTEGVSVSYDLPGKLSIPSRHEQQLVNIASITGKAEFVMVATPLLSDYVYREAEVVNNSDKILLAGEASMFCNGDFVGKDGLKLVTMGEKTILGFGVDSQIRILREFQDKKADTLWGNRVETFEYRIAISNYKNTAVKLRLTERLPYTEDEYLQIRDFKTNTPMSTDAEYIRVLKDKGILRWDLDLQPNTTEQGATVVTYGFTMKYDNDMHVTASDSEK